MALQQLLHKLYSTAPRIVFVKADPFADGDGSQPGANPIKLFTALIYGFSQ
jgi:hypothetical protein